LARKAIYKHATEVNASSYPDDGTSPVGTTEWNEDPAPQGMIGNTPTTATITIASGIATVTDTITVVTSESSTSDTLDKLAITNTSQYDLIYLFANTGHTITLTHTASPSADGHVFTVSGANETLSVTKPTILIRKGSYWYGYGGTAASTPTDITVADESSDTTCFPLYVTAATGDLAPKSGSNLAFNSSSGVLTATGFAGPITGNVTGNASGSSATCSGLSATATALATGRTIGQTGDVVWTSPSFDGSGNVTAASTIQAGAVELSMIANAAKTQALIIAASDETTALTTGTAKATFRMPYAFTLTAIRASVTTAPTGSVATIDVNEGGSTILSTKITIDASEKTSTSAATAAVLSDTSLADDAEITIDIDGVGSTVAGTGLKVALIGYKT
jgi:hypothetical protein